MADLTPITRKEKIIAGENIEPITREEIFLKEYGGGGGGTSGLTIERIPFTYAYPYWTLEKSIFDYDIVAVFLGSNSQYAPDGIHFNTYLGNYSFISIGNLTKANGTAIILYQKFMTGNTEGYLQVTVGGEGEELGKILQYVTYESIRTDMIHFIGIKF